ncbi:phosphoribosylglycinamide formyltransferase [Campylobacter sp. faydin G-24]|uniref:Phosphoribosylglycinamide formyltransferase n=1 Tax=Campylobacter anatolicus TaxID=2829105 RepID=A0ABS5HG58_9BACT|nr:phosphoribosylglycinamide formyltransferase [Campylobacter anatolicus]MBR8463253.1 phosphoribosylglycinamide formyltransferase [Campylobacter anatolicus]
MQTKKIAVLFSGYGSNLESILEHVHNKIYNGVKFEVVLTISNKADAYGIVRAAKYGLKSVVIENKAYKSREEFDVALVAEIKKYDVDLVVLAGFMRILTSVFTSAVKAINLHPSILPLFKGANAIKESYESDMQVGGVSVHWVSEELDGGKIIAQRTFERTENMSKEAWESRIHEIEHELLPQSIIKILSK